MLFIFVTLSVHIRNIFQSNTRRLAYNSIVSATKIPQGQFIVCSHFFIKVLQTHVTIWQQVFNERFICI